MASTQDYASGERGRTSMVMHFDSPLKLASRPEVRPYLEHFHFPDLPRTLYLKFRPILHLSVNPIYSTTRGVPPALTPVSSRRDDTTSGHDPTLVV